MTDGGPLPRQRGRPMLLLAVIVGAGVIGVSLTDRVTSEPAAPLPAGHGVVRHVIDGDTVDIEIGGTVERVRLVGVDTPETVHRDQPVECFGPEASAATKGWLPPGTEVRLERDDVARDRYGRLLAYVYRADDDLLVNLALVEGGFADAVSFGDNEALYATFVAAEAAARADRMGLWGACGGPDVPLDEAG